MPTQSELNSSQQLPPEETRDVSERLYHLLGDDPSVRQLRANDAEINKMIAEMLQLGLPKPPIVPQE